MLSSQDKTRIFLGKAGCVKIWAAKSCDLCSEITEGKVRKLSTETNAQTLTCHKEGMPQSELLDKTWVFVGCLKGSFKRDIMKDPGAKIIDTGVISLAFHCWGEGIHPSIKQLLRNLARNNKFSLPLCTLTTLGACTLAPVFSPFSSLCFSFPALIPHTIIFSLFLSV